MSTGEQVTSALLASALNNLNIKARSWLSWQVPIISDKSHAKAVIEEIKTDKNFLNEKGEFDRIKYEKFLLENNQSAVSFESGIKGVALQKNLFDYIGAGTSVPKFLAKKLYEEENRNIAIEYINLENFYKKKDEFTETEIMDFLKQNENELKVEYIDFDYAILNPKNLVISE